MTVDRARVAFLRELTDRHDCLVVWKHLHRALRGRGDIDAAVPAAQVEGVVDDALAIAGSTLDASHVIRCDHVADKHLLFFVQPARLPHLFELDLCVQPSRGLSPWASPAALHRVSQVQEDGIRGLRSGAEAVVSLVYHGVSRSGRDRLTGDERDIVERGTATDLEGAYRACAVLAPRPARAPLRNLVADLSQGNWNRADSQRVYAAFLGSAVAHPAFLARRTAFRARLATGRECVMSRIARKGDRCVPPAGLSAMVAAAEREHPVLSL